MEPLANIPGNEVENHHMENPQTTASPKSDMSELKEEEFWSLSGKPYFTMVFSRTQLKRSYLMLPAKIIRILPSSLVPVVLTCCGKNWGMVYLGYTPPKRFDPAWKTFVNDNDLKVGDACVFELMESSSEIIKFRVQILRGDFPPELQERISGETSNTPIILD